MAKRDPIVLEDPICETAPGQPAVIYTGAVYGALKKKRQRTQHKNRLIYGSEQHMGSCVDAHNQECVFIGGGAMGCVREALFTGFVGVMLRNASLDVLE